MKKKYSILIMILAVLLLLAGGVAVKLAFNCGNITPATIAARKNPWR